MMGQEEVRPAVLDVEQGIARLMGKQRAYFSILKRFAAYAGAARTIAAQLESGDHHGASRTVHTLKGAAGLMCAGEVQAIVVQLEAALAAQRVDRALVDDLQLALERVQARIATIMAQDAFPAAPADRPASPPTHGNAEQLLDCLAMLLDEGNGNAVDHADRYGPVLEETLGAAAWQAVAAAVADYDFERALAALRSSRPPAMR